MSDDRPPGDGLFGLQCPLPTSEYPTVLLAHGGGGRLSQMLVERIFLTALGNPALEVLHDGAVFDASGGRLAFSTDSYVVRPIFFPGGDIGSLAVHGTVNDLAMCGARPLALSAGFILEEGLAMDDLWRVARSMGAAAKQVGVPVATGDTKVVDRGKGDGVFINTSGIGVVPAGVDIAPRRARPGDVVILSGPLADHGVAILAVREGLRFESEVRTDSAPLHAVVGELLEALGTDVHVLRDPTRGGLASAVNEIAASARVGLRLEEARIRVREEVRGACEVLGLDPLYVANEGKFLAIVSRERADEALDVVRRHPVAAEATIAGEIVEEHPTRVVLRSRIGGERVVDMMSGEQLPRIC